MILYMTISLWVLVSSFVKPYSLLKSRIVSSAVIFLFSALLILLVPFKDFYDGDMRNYMDSFQYMRPLSLWHTLQQSNWEPLFVIMQWVISRFTADNTAYLMFSLSVYIFILLTAINRLFTNWQPMFVFFAYLNFVFFYAYIFNGMRQGFSMMFILLAMSYWLSDNPKPRSMYISSLAAGLCHYSSFPFVVAMLLVRNFPIRLKFFLVLWAVSAIMFLFDLNDVLLDVGFISNNKFVTDYSSNDLIKYYGQGTNEVKFLIFSAFVLFISLLFYKYIPLDGPKKEIYNKIIKCYTVFNTYFLLFGFVAFSNRVASYSWFLIPILICYPLLHQKSRSPLLVPAMTVVTLIIGLLTALDFYR